MDQFEELFIFWESKDVVTIIIGIPHGLTQVWPENRQHVVRIISHMYISVLTRLSTIHGQHTVHADIVHGSDPECLRNSININCQESYLLLIKMFY